MLFGAGGFIRAHMPGGHGEQATTADLTGIAEDLCCIGIGFPRGVTAPREMSGDLYGELGAGGRAIWVDGGGDISLCEVLWAIAAALERLTVDEINATCDRRLQATNMTMPTQLDDLG